MDQKQSALNDELAGFNCRWRLNRGCVLHWRHWDAEYVLFNEASGQTHFLNELGANTLNLLQDTENPLTTNQISERLASKYNLIMNTQLQSYVRNLLVELDELGLIEPCSS